MQAKNAHGGVESAKGLVQQQQARLRGQRSGERHALPLPAGQLRGPPAAHMGQLYEVQQLPHPAQPIIIGASHTSCRACQIIRACCTFLRCKPVYNLAESP